MRNDDIKKILRRKVMKFLITLTKINVYITFSVFPVFLIFPTDLLDYVSQ